MSATTTDKRVRKPCHLRDSDGHALAKCFETRGRGRAIRIFHTAISASDMARLGEWFPHAAAWVKDGKR